MRGAGLLIAVGLLAGCAARAPAPRSVAAGGPVEVHIIAFNDFHGNLEPPRLSVTVPAPAGGTVAVPAGGAAWLAATIADLRRAAPHSFTVSAGDMTGASPIVSSLFLDEPTVAAMNLIGVDFNAAGNHEFDRGAAELLRLQRGGCARVAIETTVPCRVEPFAGARFGYLAGNTITADGRSLLPASAMRTVTEAGRTVRVGFIGLTTRSTQTLVSPAGIPGIRFTDEATVANAEAARLKAAGADAIVLLIHEGGAQEGGPNDCRGLSGAIRPILDQLDPAVDLVVSGHTHRFYICDYAAYAPDRPFLLTSAGRYGTLVTDAVLTIDPAAHRVVAKRARNVVVQNDGYVGDAGPVGTTDAVARRAPDPAVGALVARYAAAAAPLAAQPAGRITAAMPKAREGSGAIETPLGNLIADAQLAATRASGAQVAFMNPGGIRAGLVPDANGALTFADLYAVQPFGNVLTVRAYSGTELMAVLEQQLDRNLMLSVAGLTYAYDTARPAGARVFDVRVAGRPLDPAATYRVTVSNFLAFGGDGFTTLAAGRDVAAGPVDIDALRDYLIRAPGLVAPPATGRIVNRTPAKE